MQCEGCTSEHTPNGVCEAALPVQHKGRWNQQFLRRFTRIKQVIQYVNPKLPLMDLAEILRSLVMGEPARQCLTTPRVVSTAPPRNMTPAAWAGTPAYTPPVSACAGPAASGCLTLRLRLGMSSPCLTRVTDQAKFHGPAH